MLHPSLRPAHAAVLLSLAASVLAQPAGATTWLVNSTGDAPDLTNLDGNCNTGGFVPIGIFLVAECTFRAALEQSSINDTIIFSSSALTPDGNGQLVLTPTTPYPPIGNTITIDGYTAPGYDTADPWALPVVVLDGTSAGAFAGLTMTSGSRGSVVLGLEIINFSNQGIYITEGNEDVVVQGCHIGVDLGNVDAGNGGSGILIADFADHNVIGQVCSSTLGCSGKGNVIAGNGSRGIEIRGDTNFIAGNRIGTDVTGTTAIPNAGYGVYATVGPDNTIGDLGGVFTGSTTIPVASGNLISGNQLGGIFVGSNGTDVFANRIGTEVTGASPLANTGSGMVITGSQTQVGDTGIGGNEIAHNSSAGVWVLAGVDNAVRGNSMRSNFNLGLDIGGFGSTANDFIDPDAGANRLQNTPVFDTSWTEYDPGTDTVDVRYLVSTSVANATYPLTIDFYVADGEEGRTWIGSEEYTAPFAANFKISSFTPAATISPGDEMVATATDATGTGNTSEFSSAVLIPEPAPLLSLVCGMGLILMLARTRRFVVAANPAPARRCHMPSNRAGRPTGIRGISTVTGTATL